MKFKTNSTINNSSATLLWLRPRFVVCIALIAFSGWLVQPALAQETLLQEGFENPFPGANNWIVGDSNPAGDTAFWNAVNSSFGSQSPHSGSRKGYCAGTGYLSILGQTLYQSSMTAFMRRTLDLRPHSTATLTFWFKIPAIDCCGDICKVFVNDDLLWSRNQPIAPWTQVSLDLTRYVGSFRTLRFEFVSDASGSSSGWYLDDISVTATRGPTNDFFAAATAISDASGFNLADNSLGTREAGEPVGANNTLWWVWTAPASECFSFTTAGSSVDTVMDVYSGTTVNGLTSIGHNNDFAGAKSQVSFSAVGGQRYYIRVGQLTGASGSIVLRWDNSRPINDDFAAALPLAGNSGTVEGDNCSATAEPGELHSADRSVWWTWTAPATGCYRFDTSGSSFDPWLTLWIGNAVDSLVIVAGTFGLPQSPRRFVAIKDTRYYLKVAGGQGEIRLNWRSDATAPVNDNFAAATALSSGSGRAISDTCQATTETGEPLSDGRTVWFRWTAPSTGCYEFHTETYATPLVMRLQVYTGTTITSLRRLAQGEALQNNYTVARFHATAGTSYSIRLHAAGGGEGNFRLEWTPDTQIPANDSFADATMLGGATGEVVEWNCNASADPGEPFSYGRTIWYKWTASANGCFTFSIAGSDIDARLEGFTGAMMGSLTRIAYTPEGAAQLAGDIITDEIKLDARAGVTYYLRADGASATEQGRIVLSWRPDTTPPAHDSFPTPAVLNSVGYGDNCNSTDGVVYWSWVPLTSGCYEMTLEGMRFPTRLWFYQNGYNAVLIRGQPARMRFQAVSGIPASIEAAGLDQGRGGMLLKVGRFTSRPNNDNFIAATPINTASGTDYGDNCNATTEPNEVANWGRTIWWRWTAPVSGCVTFKTLAPVYYLTLSAYTGNSVSELVPLVAATPSQRYESQIGFMATAGATYYIRVDGYNGAMGSLELSWNTDTTPPANDSFGAATAISDFAGSVFGHNCFASAEPGEPPNPSGRTVWWRWTAPADGCYVFTTAGSSFNFLAIFTGDQLSALRLVGKNGNFSETASRLSFQASRGVTYAIRVDGGEGAITLNWDRVTSRPSNNDFLRAIWLGALTGQSFSDNCNATAEPGEPPSAERTIWWKFVAPTSACFQFDTTGSVCDTILAVYTGNAVNNLNLVARNDDVSNGSHSQVVFDATGGTTYYIRVDGFDGTQGSVNLQWALRLSPPPNNNFTARLPIHGASGRILGDNCRATSEAGEPANAGRTVWWAWQADTSGSISFTTAGSSFDTVLAVFMGSTLSALSEVARNDDAPGLGKQSRLTFIASQGTSYWIRVDGYQGVVGTVDLSWGRPPTALKISSAVNGALVSWKGPDFRLQSASSLLTPVIWSDVPAYASVLLPKSAPRQFFRLVSE